MSSVGHVWFVDPKPHTLEVLRLDGDSYRVAATFEGDQPVRAEPFEAIELDLGLLWRWQSRRTTSRRSRRLRPWLRAV